MSNVRGIFTRRDTGRVRVTHPKPTGPVPIAKPARKGEREVVTSPPSQTLQSLLLEAHRDFEEGEWARGRQTLCKAVYVGARTGPQGLSESDLLLLLGAISSDRFDPGEAA